MIEDDLKTMLHRTAFKLLTVFESSNKKVALFHINSLTVPGIGHTIVHESISYLIEDVVWFHHVGGWGTTIKIYVRNKDV